ncbi:MAG: hypothetical protein Q4D13_02315 [Erysipelotrichaceae bacterium]|nr:hypothetical protein [Erysipelotrichaceae bacterium]
MFFEDLDIIKVGKSHYPTMEVIMQNVIKSYVAKVDSKKRVTLKSTLFDYYQVEEFADGKLLLSPRQLTEPFTVSENTLSMMDSAMENYKEGKVSEKIDLSMFED